MLLSLLATAYPNDKALLSVRGLIAELLTFGRLKIPTLCSDVHWYGTQNGFHDGRYQGLQLK